MKSPDSSSVKTILVVEDEPAISEICRRVLTSMGFEVELAVNGKVAQDMIGEKQHTLYLIDIRTPVMNGMELYQWLEENHPQVAKRVIFTTGNVVEGDSKHFLEQAARPFLPKPFTPGELMALVKETLKQVE
jgi:DNA-binding response OmpR family regulator